MRRAWNRVLADVFVRSSGRFAALDGVRALAVLLIVGFHCVVWVELVHPGTLATLPLGLLQQLLTRCWIGVDVFFVLSGFLIGRILLVQARQGHTAFRAFYLRRAFRIFPAYYVILTVSLLWFSRLNAFAAFYRYTPWATLLRRSPANYLYVSNYMFPGTPTIFDPSWSLCIEEHFYLVLPALLTVLFSSWFRRPWVVLAALVPVPLVARAVAFANVPGMIVLYRLYFESHTRADGLLLGVGIAYLDVYHGAVFSRLVARVGSLTWMTGLACVVAAFRWGGVAHPGIFPVVFQFFVVALGCGLVLINCLYTTNVVARFFGHRVWYPIARVSYGLYLVHVFPLFWIVSVFRIRPPLLVTSLPRLMIFVAGVLLLSFLIAVAMFVCLEAPLLRYGARLGRRFGDAKVADTPLAARS